MAWLVLYTHCIWLATLRVVGCTADGNELWRLLMGFAVFAFGFCFLLPAVNRLREVARIMRWLALPFGVLIPLAAWPVMTALQSTTLGGEPICGIDAAWNTWWAPVQLVTLLFIAYGVAHTWKTAGIQPNQ